VTLNVAVLGSTGSIGTQTLEIIREASVEARIDGREPPYRVVAIGAHSSAARLAEQALEFGPRTVAVTDPTAAQEVVDRIGATHFDVVPGTEGFLIACEDADVVINGVVGFAGLPVTHETFRLGRRLGLANKESLIAAGPVVQKVRSTPGAEIIPVDSEHCALHQCLRANESFDAGRLGQVRRLLVTASGGPFRGYSAAQLEDVSIDDALAHPTWSMGPKITVDSSTLMNKGLEVIEANELFGVGFDRIEVVVHPQSVVHSMVEYTDGATMAQLSMPDMRLCIAYALDFDDRHPHAYGAIDWTTLSRLDFAVPDRQAFPCLDLAYEAGRQSGTAPAALSAANEVAVEAFLAGRIAWTDIARVVEAVLSIHNGGDDPDLDAVLQADTWARAAATEQLDR
jgi:1-deoxy-D-xylulose-5-phosphate reductoisomerase